MAVWKITFVSEHLNTDQTQLTLLLLHALPVAVLALPANSVARASHAKSAKHSRAPLTRVFPNMHTYPLMQLRKCV